MQGAYRDDNGQPVVLGCVREAERRIAGSNFMECEPHAASVVHEVCLSGRHMSTQRLDLHRYLPMGGMKEFVKESVKLAYGDNAAPIRDGRVAGVQSLSGTGSCRLMADFQVSTMPALDFAGADSWLCVMGAVFMKP